MTHKHLWTMLVLLCLSAAIRLIGMTWGLPYQLHSDEPVLFINAWARWNDAPVTLQADYPPLYPILLSWQREFIYQTSGAETPQVVYFFFGRYTSLLTSLLILAAVYRLGKRFANPQAGLILALIFTVDPISVTDQGWIIKADNLAWLLGFIGLWLGMIALQTRHWKWLIGAIIAFGLAGLTKYSMIFLGLALLYIPSVWLIKREWVVALLFIFGIPLGMLGFRAFLIRYWQSDIDPIFVYCGGDSKEHLESYGIRTDKAIEWLPCEPYLAFQRFGANFYQYDFLWRERVNTTFQALNREILNYYRNWQLFLGAGLLGYGYWKKRLSPLPFAIALPSYAIFIMVAAAQHDRQYYVLFMSLNLALAGAISQLPKPWLMSTALLLFILPNLAEDIRFRADLLQADTRAETANWMLTHARQGETVIVEYDHVEFQNQYGGFPETDGYFRVIGVEGLLEQDPARLFDQGIFYVVTDFRATRSPFGGFKADLSPYGFELAYDLSATQRYFGPARRIYRTFRPAEARAANFADVVFLHGYDADWAEKNLKVRLYWHVQQENLPDLSLFVHFQAENTGEIVSQQDAPPTRLSRFWEQYEWVFDERNLDLSPLPEGDYQILIGWYDPRTGERLPVNGDPLGIFPLLRFRAQP